MLERIITISSGAAAAITTIISILANIKKNKKGKIVQLAKICQKISNYINEAEKIFGSGTGSAKLAYVLNKVQIECITNKVEYNEDQWKGEIERTLSTPQKKENKNEEN